MQKSLKTKNFDVYILHAILKYITQNSKRHPFYKFYKVHALQCIMNLQYIKPKRHSQYNKRIRRFADASKNAEADFAADHILRFLL